MEEYRGYYINFLSHKRGYEVYKRGFKRKTTGILWWKQTHTVPAKIYVYDSPFGNYRGHTDDQISYQLPDNFDSIEDAQKAIDYIMDVDSGGRNG